MREVNVHTCLVWAEKRKQEDEEGTINEKRRRCVCTELIDGHFLLRRKREDCNSFLLEHLLSLLNPVLVPREKIESMTTEKDRQRQVKDRKRGKRNVKKRDV